jgi:predicted acyl esterase
MNPNERTESRVANGSAYTRRGVLGRIGSVAAFAALGTRTARGAESYEIQRGLRITSWDGSDIAADLYVPDVEEPHPSMLITHGWGGDKRSGTVTRLADLYASNGYVVLAYDSRGFGESDGEASVDGPKETRDASALVTWLAGHSEVRNDGPDDPKVGMDGISYGGAIQPLTAVEDDRLDAIVPRWFWFDLAYGSVPNGVYKHGWDSGFRALGPPSTRGISSGDGKPSGEDVRHGVDEEFYEFWLEALATGEYPDDGLAYLLERSPKLDIESLSTPMLAIQGWYDTAQPPNQAVWTYQAAREQGVPAKLLLFGGGHTITDTAGPKQRRFLDRSALSFIEEHVRGVDDACKLAPITMYETQTGEWQSATQWPPRRTTLASGRFGAVASGESTTIANSVAPSSTSQLAPVNTETESTSASFDFPIRRDCEIVGTPRISLALEPLGTTSFAFVKVYHLRDNGSGELINNQATPFRADTTPMSTSVQQVGGELAAFQRSFDQGDTLRVTVATTDAGFASARESIGVRIHHSVDHPSTATFPVIGMTGGPLTRQPVRATRSDDGSVFTAGGTDQISLDIESDRPVRIRDRIPSSWEVVAGDPNRTHIDDDIRLVEFAKPVANDTRTYFAEAPEDGGSIATSFGPAEYFDANAERWLPISGTTETNFVAPTNI